MKLKADKRYTRRNGSVTKDPLTYTGHMHYPFECADRSYTEEGAYCRGGSSELDLIAEYVEPALDNSADTPKETAVQSFCRDIAKRDEQARLDAARIAELVAELVYQSGINTTIKSVNDQLKARVEELEAKGARLYDKELSDVIQERDTLRTQVSDITSMWTEACTQLADTQENLSTQTALRVFLKDDNEELRTQLAEAERLRDLWVDRAHVESEKLAAVTATRDDAIAVSKKHADRVDELQAELAAYNQPKLVGSTWQGLCDDGVAGKLHEHPGALIKWFPAVIRRDTYKRPDGSTYVVASLETSEVLSE